MSFPLEPFGCAIVIKTYDLELTAGGLALPKMQGKTLGGDGAYGEVLAVGIGVWSEQGALIRPMTKVGDMVIFPRGAAMGIDPGVGRILDERGIKDINKLCVVMEPNIIARILPAEDAAITTG